MVRHVTSVLDLPGPVAKDHDGWTCTFVYGPYAYRTWKLVSPSGEVHFCKVGPVDVYPSIRDERLRMAWARKYLPVPKVLDHGVVEDIEWLVTSGLTGQDATTEQLKQDPSWLVPVLARGLRRFHEAPVEDCPFDFTVDAAVRHCDTRVTGGREMWDDLHEDFKHLTPLEMLIELYDNRPPQEDLVVCHGDYCFPNMLIEGNEVTGFVDLGELGVADRWWDLAVATWSCDWNVGPGWQDVFLDAYGIERDEHKIRYYRMMYDLAS